MKYYIIEKQSEQSFGPFDSKEDADKELGRVLEVVGDTANKLYQDIKIDVTQRMDDWVVSNQGNTIARYEIIGADQFDNPDQIPMDFQ